MIASCGDLAACGPTGPSHEHSHTNTAKLQGSVRLSTDRVLTQTYCSLVLNELCNLRSTMVPADGEMLDGWYQNYNGQHPQEWPLTTNKPFVGNPHAK